MYGKASNRQKLDQPRLKPHVHKGDTVVVLSGRDAGKRGKVLRVNAVKGTAIVERVNFTKKHTKANPSKNQQGGILEREAPVNISKLMVVCPSCGEPARLGSHRTDEGAQRYCRKCEANLE